MKVECGLLVDMSPNGDATYKTTYSPMEIQQLLFGNNEEGVKWLVCQIGELPPLPDGLPKQQKLEKMAEQFRKDYNDLHTGITLEFKKKKGRKKSKAEGGLEPPTCIRWEWVNGELVARYNWAMTYTADKEKISARVRNREGSQSRSIAELTEQIAHCEAYIHISLICYREMLESQSFGFWDGEEPPMDQSSQRQTA